MARVDSETLTDPERIFLATTLRQARRVEELLTSAGIEYIVDVEAYGRSFLFGSVRHGAVFYASPSQAAVARAHLNAAGLAKWVLEAEPADERNR